MAPAAAAQETKRVTGRGSGRVSADVSLNCAEQPFEGRGEACLTARSSFTQEIGGPWSDPEGTGA